MEITETVEEVKEARKKPSGILEYLDGILRHREDYFNSIFENEDVVEQISRLFIIVIVLSGVYGIAMGVSSGVLQVLSSAIKVPVLYLLTLMVCYPVLYIVNVVMGSRLSFLQTLALIMMAMALNSILLASCAPMVLFFTITGSDYHFLKLLNVAIMAFSGVWAMIGLWKGLQAMCETSSLYPKQAVKILRIWILVFALVGAQMAWSLRPFVGSPGMPFQIFREYTRGNFYMGVWSSIESLTETRGTVVSNDMPTPSKPMKKEDKSEQ